MSDAASSVAAALQKKVVSYVTKDDDVVVSTILRASAAPAAAEQSNAAESRHSYKTSLPTTTRIRSDGHSPTSLFDRPAALRQLLLALFGAAAPLLTPS